MQDGVGARIGVGEFVFVEKAEPVDRWNVTVARRHHSKFVGERAGDLLREVPSFLREMRRCNEDGERFVPGGSRGMEQRRIDEIRDIVRVRMR